MITTLKQLVCLLALLYSSRHTNASSSPRAKARRLLLHHHDHESTINKTNVDACKMLVPQTKVHYPSSSLFSPDEGYKLGTKRYMKSSSQKAACVFIPTLPQEISDALKLIAKTKIHFAISSGGHASNQGFSSTTGIQISMKGFQHVNLSDDKAYVDIGAGNIWDNVYQVLEGSGVNDVGGRVTGVGVGGFITGEGGFSWKTNQYGLTVDTLIQANLVLPNGDIVTASQSMNPDLFFAIKGGGNQFGIIYNFRLATIPQSKTVYGGLRTYLWNELPAMAKAVSNFSANNKDPKAQIIPTFNTLLDSTGVALLAFYDGSDPGSAFSAFDGIHSLTDEWGSKKFVDLVRGSPSNVTSGLRGAFHTVSLQSYSEPLLVQIINQSHYYGTRHFKSDFFISYDVEPFLNNYGQKFANKLGESAWPHTSSPLPLNLYFAWELEKDDEYFQNAIVQSAKLLTNQAILEGQNLSQYTLYPNYSINGTSAVEMYGSVNAVRLKKLKAKYDPENVMSLTTSFSFD